MLATINKLHEITRIDRRTIKKRIGDVQPIRSDGNGDEYETSVVLPRIYEVEKEADGKLVAAQEKAALDRARRELVELELAERRHELIPVEIVKRVWTKMFGAFRAKILGLPVKLTPRLAATSKQAEVSKILQKECNAALNALKAFNPKDYGTGSDS